MLRCLDAKTAHFPQGAYILRAGDTVESLGLMVSGNAFIIQEDFWGNRNILSYMRFNEKVTHLGQRTTRAKLLSYLSAEAQRHNSFRGSN